MRHILVVISALVIRHISYGQNTEIQDTIQSNKELSEIVVVGQNQRAKAGELIFTPSKRQKEIANDGFELLQQLDMPQISVEPKSFSVKTITGKDIALFINGIPATTMDVRGLKTTDVRSVNYYEFSSDPRFKGSDYAINYIVKEIGGGYTKGHFSGSTYGLTSSCLALFSKYNYKRMSYDLYLEWDYVNRHDGGSDTYENYSLLSPDGTPYTATRNSLVSTYRQRNGGIPVSFRATYSGNNFQAVNTLGFNYHSTPADQSTDKLYIWPDTDTGHTASRAANSRTRSYSWNGFFYLKLSERVDMSVNTQVLYGHNNYASLYSTDMAGSQDILRNSKENALSAAIYASARYKTSSSSSLSARLYASDDDNSIDYAGSSVFTSDYNGFEAGGAIAYDATLPINLRLHADAGVEWNRSNVNGQRDYTLRPTANINASYASVNNKHQLNMTANYVQSSPGISAKTPNVIQYNEFLYAKGNPLLKNNSQLNSWISYMWLPSNTFNAGLVAQYNIAFDYRLEQYSHYKEGSALLRTYINDGNFQQWNIILQANYRPITNLRFTAMAVYNTTKRTSKEVSRTIHPFYGNLSVQYDIKKFWVSAKAYLPETFLSITNAAKFKKPFCYTLAAGWSNGCLNVKISANNLFDKHWRTESSEMSMPLYSKSSVQYGNFTFRNVSFTLSYTINYGNKVRHDNELGRPQDAKSGIMK